MQSNLAQLKERLATMTDLNLANSLLYWDQATMLPDKGAEQRSRQLATLSRMAHEILTSKETGDLISSLEKWASTQPSESADVAFILEAKRIRDLEVKVPSKLNSEMAEHYARMYSAWTQARPKNDFASLKPLLEKSIELSKQFSSCFPGMTHAGFRCGFFIG